MSRTPMERWIGILMVAVGTIMSLALLLVLAILAIMLLRGSP